MTLFNEARFTGCPSCGSDDYFELDDLQRERGGYLEDGPPVYRCEECGEEWG